MKAKLCLEVIIACMAKISEDLQGYAVQSG